MQLMVGTDSTWSLRAWMCGQLADVEFDVYVIDLNQSDYKTRLANLSDTGLVPVLNDNGLHVHDSLAITEYLNELSNNSLYPDSSSEKALARSLCCELHSGFINLRTICPFTLAPTEPLSEVSDALNRELKRVELIFNSAKLPFMFEKAGAVDAFYSILAFRLKSYGFEFEGRAGEYLDSLLDWPILQQAISVAREWKKT